MRFEKTFERRPHRVFGHVTRGTLTHAIEDRLDGELTVSEAPHKRGDALQAMALVSSQVVNENFAIDLVYDNAGLARMGSHRNLPRSVLTALLSLSRDSVASWFNKS